MRIRWNGWGFLRCSPWLSGSMAAVWGSQTQAVMTLSFQAAPICLTLPSPTNTHTHTHAHTLFPSPSTSLLPLLNQQLYCPPCRVVSGDTSHVLHPSASTPISSHALLPDWPPLDPKIQPTVCQCSPGGSIRITASWPQTKPFWPCRALTCSGPLAP